MSNGRNSTGLPDRLARMPELSRSIKSSSGPIGGPIVLRNVTVSRDFINRAAAFEIPSANMDLSKIKTLIDFVGRSSITELTVTEKDLTVRLFRSQPTAGEASFDLARGQQPAAGASITLGPDELSAIGRGSVIPVKAPVSGVLHRSSAPGEGPFVKPGDEVTEGQTLFIIEAMKVFNKIAASRSGRIVSLTEIDGGEVETGDLLAEIA